MTSNQERCSNHPDAAALSSCHHCGRHYCADCLQEGAEFYYCAAPECQAALKKENLPDSVPCPKCCETVYLDRDERVSKRFRCPGCRTVVDYSGDDGSLTTCSVEERAPEFYFAVSPLKLIILSIGTLGFYQVYWFWQNWTLVKDQTGEKLIPILRAVFPIFFCYDLFLRIRMSAESVNLPVRYSPGWITIRYLLLGFAWYLPAPYSLIGFSAIFLVLPVQSTINAIARLYPEKTSVDETFSPLNLLGVGAAAILVFLFILGTLNP